VSHGHPWLVHPIQHSLPSSLVDERLSVFRPYAGLRQLSSCFNRCVLRRESNRPRKQTGQEFAHQKGEEMHEPDRMYLNPSQIVFVGTVGTNSKVAELIAQAPH